MKKQWFETWFDSPYYDLLYRNRDEQEAQRFLDQLLFFLQPPANAKFLDLGCGKGRHSVYLSRKGYEVDGADISPNNIRIASDNQSNRLRFFEHDMRNMLPFSNYDFILNLFTSFGYFDSDEQHIQTLSHTYNALNLGGKFVLDYLNPDVIRIDGVKTEVKTIEGISFEISKQIQNGRILKKIKVIDRGETYEYQESVRAYGKKELTFLLSQAGYSTFGIYGNYKLEPYSSQDSERLIIVGEK